MAVRLADKIKQSNNADFFLLDAEDVEMQDGTSLEDKIASLENGSGGASGDGAIDLKIVLKRQEDCLISDSMLDFDNSFVYNEDTGLIETIKTGGSGGGSGSVVTADVQLLTQAEYNILENKDPNVLYIIIS